MAREGPGEEPCAAGSVFDKEKWVVLARTKMHCLHSRATRREGRGEPGRRRRNKTE